MRSQLVSIFLVLLAGCSDDAERVYTVEELMADEALLVEWVGKCRDNPGELGDTPNCQNAAAADFKARLGRMGKVLGG
ncbi:EexN family lipoprotein [Ciceribacter thiooxidans]|uniref:EexN family lipoprotein n=1 Tax=Ciceribacter thiooxidans TaxID=1969821 RepID=A0ABV7I1U6_9HYPH